MQNSQSLNHNATLFQKEKVNMLGLPLVLYQEVHYLAPNLVEARNPSAFYCVRMTPNPDMSWVAMHGGKTSYPQASSSSLKSALKVPAISVMMSVLSSSATACSLSSVLTKPWAVTAYDATLHAVPFECCPTSEFAH